MDGRTYQTTQSERKAGCKKSEHELAHTREDSTAPVSSEMSAPITKRPTAAVTIPAMTAAEPLVKRNGMSGMIAPNVNKTNEDPPLRMATRRA